MMDALAKHDPLDPASADVMKADFAGSVTKDVKGLKIGVVRHFFEKDAEIDPRSRRASRRLWSPSRIWDARSWMSRSPRSVPMPIAPR